MDEAQDKPAADETVQAPTPAGGGLDDLEAVEAIEDAGKTVPIKHPVTGAVLGYFLVSFLGTGSFNAKLNRLKERWLTRNSKPRGQYHVIPQNEQDTLANEAAIGTLCLYFWGFRQNAGGELIPNRRDGSYSENAPLKENRNRHGKKIGMVVDLDQVHVANMEMIYGGYREVRRQVDAVAMERDEFLSKDGEAVKGN